MTMNVIVRKLNTLSQILTDEKKVDKHIMMEIVKRNSYYPLLRMAYKIKGNRDGVKVMEEEWDYLIVLDACRYDMFKKANRIKGLLEKKISLGSNTPGWLKKNFNGYYEDIVYISANPHISNYEVRGFKGTDHFWKVKNLWYYDWDNVLESVHPRRVTKSALRIIRKYHGKRFIIHYLQPHQPYILSPEINHDLVRRGKISIRELRRAYMENLILVLNEVEKLIDVLEGKIVITSDHGQLLGEKFELGHPAEIYFKELIEIPWLVVDKK